MIQFDDHVFQTGWNHQLDQNGSHRIHVWYTSLHLLYGLVGESPQNPRKIQVLEWPSLKQPIDTFKNGWVSKFGISKLPGGPHFQVLLLLVSPGGCSTHLPRINDRQIWCKSSTLKPRCFSMTSNIAGVFVGFLWCWQSWHPTVGVPNLGKIECNWWICFFQMLRTWFCYRLYFILYIPLKSIDSAVLGAVFFHCFVLFSQQPNKNKNKTTRLFRGDDNFDKQELLDHNIEVFKEVGFPCRVNRLVGGYCSWTPATIIKAQWKNGHASGILEDELVFVRRKKRW